MSSELYSPAASISRIVNANEMKGYDTIDKQDMEKRSSFKLVSVMVEI